MAAMSKSSDKSQMRLSFLNALNDIAITPTELTFTTLSYSGNQSRETTQRPATSRKCSAQQPELPVPVYDNGNITVTKTTKPTVHVPYFKAPNEVAEADFGGQDNDNHLLQYQELQRPDHNEDVEFNRFLLPSKGFDLRHKKSLPESQLASMFNTLRRQSADTARRPRTSGSSRKIKGMPKKTISYEEQRCDPPRTKETYKRLRALPSPTLARHPLKLITSLKDFHSRSENHHEASQALPDRLQQDVHVTGPRDSMITIREALDAAEPSSAQDHNVQNCGNIHSLKLGFEEQSPTRHGFPLLYGDASPSQQLPTQSLPMNTRHERGVSEAGSGVSSILDWEWPQPSSESKSIDGRAISNNHGLPRPDSDVVLSAMTERPPAPTVQALSMLNDMVASSTTSQSRPRLVRTSLSPPPDKPLPSLPNCQIKPDEPSPSRTVYDNFRPKEFRSASVPTIIQHSRSGDATTDGKLYIDCSDPLHRDLNTNHSDLPPVVFPPPLRLRLRNNYRNGRVESLRRRHLLTMIKDDDSIKDYDASCSFNEDFLRRGSAPSTLQTSSANDFIKSSQTSDCSIGIRQSKLLPATSAVRKHRHQKSSASSTIRSKSSLPKRKSNQDNGLVPSYGLACDQIASPHVAARNLARSCVKIVVDSDPKHAYGFRAGNISPKLDQSTWNHDSTYVGSSRQRKGSVTSVYSRPSTAGSCGSVVTSNGTDGTDITTLSLQDTHCFEAHPGNRLAQYDEKEVSPISKPTYGFDFTEKVSCTKLLLPSLIEDNQNDRKIQNHDKERPEFQGVDRLEAKHDTVTGDPQSQIDRLNSELDRMTRVYRCMIHSRTGLKPEGIRTKTYAELLEDDRRANAVARGRSRRTSAEVSPKGVIVASVNLQHDSHQSVSRAKDLQSSHDNSKKSIPELPTETDPNYQALKTLNRPMFKERSSSLPTERSGVRRGSQPQGRVVSNIPAKFSLYPSTRKHPLAATLPIVPPRQTVIIPKKTPTRPSTSSTTTNGKESKRHSLVSMYSAGNFSRGQKTPRTSPVLKGAHMILRNGASAMEEASPTPSVRRLVAQAHDHPTEDIDLDVDPSLDLNHFFTSTSQMDQAIDKFVMANEAQPLSPLEDGFATQDSASQ